MRPVRWLSAALLLSCGLAQAQDYPAKPIRLVVPYPAGGPVDAIARIVGGQLVRVRSQTVYYILSRIKSICRVWLNRERAAGA